MNNKTILVSCIISVLIICTLAGIVFLNNIIIDASIIRTVFFAIMIVGLCVGMVFTKIKIEAKEFRILSYIIFLVMIIAFAGKIFITSDIWNFILWLVCLIGLGFLLFLCAKFYLQRKNLGQMLGPSVGLVVSALVIMIDTSAFSYENNQSSTLMFIICAVLFVITLVSFLIFKKTFCKLFITLTNKMLACLGAFLISFAISFISVGVLNQSFVFKYELQTYTIVDMGTEPSGKSMLYYLVIEDGPTQKKLFISKENYNFFNVNNDITLRYYHGTLGLNYYKYFTSDNN